MAGGVGECESMLVSEPESISVVRLGEDRQGHRDRLKFRRGYGFALRFLSKARNRGVRTPAQRVRASAARHGLAPTSARIRWSGWYTMLGQRNTSLVQVQSPALIERRSDVAWAECQSSGKALSARLPTGSCDSQKLTSPFE